MRREYLRRRRVYRGGASAYQKGVAAELRTYKTNNPIKKLLNAVVHSGDATYETPWFLDETNTYKPEVDQVIVPALRRLGVDESNISTYLRRAVDGEGFYKPVAGQQKANPLAFAGSWEDVTSGYQTLAQVTPRVFPDIPNENWSSTLAAPDAYTDRVLKAFNLNPDSYARWRSNFDNKIGKAQKAAPETAWPRNLGPNKHPVITGKKGAPPSIPTVFETVKPIGNNPNPNPLALVGKQYAAPSGTTTGGVFDKFWRTDPAGKYRLFYPDGTPFPDRNDVAGFVAQDGSVIYRRANPKPRATAGISLPTPPTTTS